MNVLSVCSGIGGLDLGLQRAGMTIVGQVEIDAWCRSILTRHWPHVPRHDDIRTTAAWWLSERRPHVDLIAGGIPCQPFSGAGHVRGTADKRWLWPAFDTLVEALSPAWALIENVPGIRNHGLGHILGDLAVRGFDAWWSRVPAAAVGAPHLRWRLFVVAAHPERAGTSFEPRRRGRQDGEDQVHAGWDGALWGLACGGRGRQALRGSDRGTAAGNGTWAVEPGVGRVAHGVPARVDRLRGFGDAVVPQVAEYVGGLIMSSLPEKES